MTKNLRASIFLLRLSMGWFFFYAGITKVLNPEWSAEGYLLGAKTFTGLFSWFASPGVLPFVDFLNQWGLIFLGVSLILGVFVRFSSFFGVVLMLLYYLPILVFPHIPPHSYIVEEHIIYALVLVLLAVVGAGRFWGLDAKWGTSPAYKKWLG